jgi:hypothetical protein
VNALPHQKSHVVPLATMAGALLGATIGVVIMACLQIRRYPRPHSPIH